MALNPRNTQSMKQHLLETHREWRNNIGRWRFLIDSYNGGQYYRDGKYLTAYQMESEADYETRLDTTPYDNHVRSIVSIYNSFLFREPPKRELGNLADDETVGYLLKDADLDGRSFDAVMREISAYASVYGHVWLLLDKPPSNANTRAEELNQGIRPYISIVTPENVLDWEYQRLDSGYYELTYLKIFEGNYDGIDVIRKYQRDSTEVWEISHNEDARMRQTFDNPLGRIPAIIVYGKRGPVKGIGVSDIGDVADMCRSIYQELSEVEQLGRLTNHPSLVKTASTSAGAGAGSIIQMPEDLQPELKPYLLQPDGASLEGFLESMQHKILSIDRMSHMGGIRSIESRRLSGVALSVEFQLLNASLAAKADELEHAEEQIWRLYAQWQGLNWDGEVKYPDSFNIQDRYNEMNNLKMAKESQPRSQTLHRVIEQNMLKLLVSEEEYTELKDTIDVSADVTAEIAQPSPPAARTYENGEPIDPRLPPAYQDSSNPEVPEGQQCENCQHYDPELFICRAWNGAAVRPMFWCRRWEPTDEQ